MNRLQNFFEDLIDWIFTPSSEQIPSWAFTVGVMIGTAVVEYFYFTEAEKVRLVFVILLIPAGALGGAFLPFIVNLLAKGIVILIALLFAVAATYYLYSFFVWFYDIVIKTN